MSRRRSRTWRQTALLLLLTWTAAVAQEVSASLVGGPLCPCDAPSPFKSDKDDNEGCCLCCQPPVTQPSSGRQPANLVQTHTDLPVGMLPSSAWFLLGVHLEWQNAEAIIIHFAFLTFPHLTRSPPAGTQA